MIDALRASPTPIQHKVGHNFQEQEVALVTAQVFWGHSLLAFASLEKN